LEGLPGKGHSRGAKLEGYHLPGSLLATNLQGRRNQKKRLNAKGKEGRGHTRRVDTELIPPRRRGGCASRTALADWKMGEALGSTAITLKTSPKETFGRKDASAMIDFDDKEDSLASEKKFWQEESAKRGEDLPRGEIGASTARQTRYPTYH